MAGNVMDARDLSQAIFAGNDIAMQWYGLTHQVTIPNAGTVTVNPNSGTVQVGSGILVLIALVVVGGFFLLKD
jgi:hypothetical protein